MARCRVKRGFFVLSDCGRPADLSCSKCQRAACDEHLTQRDGQPLCHDCRAREEQSDHYHDNWPHRYRHGYYSGHGYHALYYGSHRDSYYDDYEVRAFDKSAAQEGADFEEDPGGSFFDS